MCMMNEEQPLSARNNCVMSIHSWLLYHNRRLISSPRICLAHCCETIFSGVVTSEKSTPVAYRWTNSDCYPLCPSHSAIGLNYWRP